MSMSRASLIADLKASLHDAAEVFEAEDGDFGRHLDVAALDLARYRPRTLLGTLTLEPDRAGYPAPADLVQIKIALWGRRERTQRKPWDPGWPGQLPRLQVVETAGGREVHLMPAPTMAQIACLGATCQYYYYAAHRVAAEAAETTVRPADRGLLLLRAQVEALREIAVRNSFKPVQMRDGLHSQPRNGTPAALYRELLAEFERAAA